MEKNFVLENFVLENLCCSSCAAKIEKKAAGIESVTSASVDLVTKRLSLKHDGSVASESLEKEIKKIVKSIEPNVNVLSVESGKVSKNEKFPKELLKLILGALIYAAGFLANAFHANRYAVLAIFVISLAVSGGEVFFKAFRNTVKGRVFDENLLMSIAAVGAFAIGQFEEGAAVMLFYGVGEYFQDLATERSKKSITDLMGLRPDYANLVTESGTKKVSPEKVKKGDRILVKPGERVPLDGVVVSGSSFVDTSGITGEPVPREVAPGANVTGGFINKDGLLTVEVLKEYSESTVAKIIDLVENAGSKKAKAENFITRFARVYTPVVTTAALLIAVVPPLLLRQPFGFWIYRALIFLVVSCPCALVVSVPLGFFAGIGAASRNGILVKGGSYLEKLAEVKTVVFDKTGTLTKGVFEVTQTDCADGVTPKELLKAAAAAESASSHPIAKSIIKAYGKDLNAAPENVNEIAGIGVIAYINGKMIAAGSEKLMKRESIDYKTCGAGGTLVYVAENGKYLGCIVITDIIKEDTPYAVKGLRSAGIKKTVMLTGDREKSAKAVAESAGIDEVHAELLPDQKVEEFEKAADGVTAFVGDGINDAPSLARADIGIAMGGAGSDAAVEAADIVLMDDSPSKLVAAVRIARYTRAIVRENIIFALAVKFAVLILGAVGIANIWTAVFADTGVAVLAVLNSLRTLARSKRFAQIR